MKIPPFRLERFFAQHEFHVPHLLCCSDCESMSVAELLALEPGSAERLQELRLGYIEARGSRELRQRIAALYPGIDPDDVLVHSGAEEAIFNAMNVLLAPGDHVIVHTPAYQSLLEVARSIGCEVTEWAADPEHGWKLDLSFLEDQLRPATRLVIVNCPHNPTGHVMPREEFVELVGLSRSHGFRLFSDEVYRFLEHDAAIRLPAACELDDRSISLGVMSKSYGLAGLRIGWTVTRDRQLTDRLAAFKDYTTICSSAPSELLAAVALAHHDTIVGRNLALLRKNLQLLEAFFERHASRFRWSRPVAGPITFPSLREGDAQSFCDRVRESAGVLLLPGSLYGDHPSHFRMGFGRRDMPEALRHLETFLQT